MTERDGVPVDLAIALSGGGHRASVFAVGAMLAIVDRRLNPVVSRISSVSGGSLTNASLAAAADFRSMTPHDADALAADLVGRFRGRHLFSVRTVVLRVVAVAGVAAALAHRVWRSCWGTLLVGLCAWATASMSTGRLLQRAINRQHFRHTRPTLGDLEERVVTHDFCATDLLTGMPIVFTTATAEARRRVPLPDRTGDVAVQRWPCGELQLAAAVRASAAFPGIAPKAVRFKQPHQPIETVSFSRGVVPGTAPLGRIAVAGDGGIWNNLGTQAIREERGNNQPPIIAVNASATPKPSRAWKYRVPGLALVAALLRTALILNRNTVEPRVEAVTEALIRRHRDGRPPTFRDPLTVVVDLRRIEDTWWEIKRLAHDSNDGASVSGRCGVTSAEVEYLKRSNWLAAVIDLDKCSNPIVGTKFTTITEHEALTLLLRGYVNTFLWSLLVRPLAEDELPQAGAKFVERLQGLAGRRR